eukprot:TRINITY_DN3264_c0_g1_i1.p1 TRINITY_DN3264_c0_g1~~TRINITY_DN3264_c0_g1_i1.p1  ORF type:complete len:489 (-),score=103.65 TRINITY_DN3264_c0_g1_i1:399-1865(-)
MSDDDIFCAGCSKMIEGAYAIVDGKNFHKDCVNYGTCPGCNQAIRGGMIASVNGKEWHKECFDKSRGGGGKCPGCNNPIVSGTVVKVGDVQWHKDCYEAKKKATPPAPKYTCGGCNTPITSGKILQVLDKHWHSTCFKCTRCSSLLSSEFFDMDGSPYCRGCLDQMKQQKQPPPQQQQQAPPVQQRQAPPNQTQAQIQARQRPQSFLHTGPTPNSPATQPKAAAKPQAPQVTCGGCGEGIVGPVAKAMNKTWHPGCFKCSKCAGTLQGGFLEGDGKPFCQPCATKHQEEQRQARDRENERRVQEQFQRQQQAPAAVSAAVSPSVVCGNCSKGIIGSYTEFKGRPFCDSCAQDIQAQMQRESSSGVKCAACSKTIADRYVTAMNQHYHPECLVCCACKLPLPKDFKIKEKKFYCQNDYDRLFGVSICAGCGERISGKYSLWEDAKYHPHCFVCQGCHNPFTSDQTFQKAFDDKFYCEECFVNYMANLQV